MNIIQLGLISIAVMLLTLFIIKYKSIMSFLFPQQWVHIVMLESDNNISEWLQSKNSELRFTFNNGFYNMFDTCEKIEGDSTGKRKVYGGTSIYRMGRLATFIYIEGNENPVDLRNLSITGNPQLNKQLLRVDLSKLFVDSNTGIDAFLKKVMPFLIIIGIVVIIVILLSKGNTSPTAVTPTPTP